MPKLSNDHNPKKGFLDIISNIWIYITIIYNKDDKLKYQNLFTKANKTSRIWELNKIISFATEMSRKR